MVWLHEHWMSEYSRDAGILKIAGLHEGVKKQIWFWKVTFAQILNLEIFSYKSVNPYHNVQIWRSNVATSGCFSCPSATFFFVGGTVVAMQIKWR